MMKNETNIMIEKIRNTDNPIIKAKTIEYYLIEMLEEKKITLYESYLIQEEVINYTRESYTKLAWNGRVTISNCIEILNQRLLALIYNEVNNMDLLYRWGIEALQLCKEQRKHYIIDKYEKFITISNSNDDLLKELYEIRKRYDFLSDEDGPYHVEVFPYHYYEPETILLNKRYIIEEKSISEDVETILIELSI